MSAREGLGAASLSQRLRLAPVRYLGAHRRARDRVEGAEAGASKKTPASAIAVRRPERYG